MKEWVTLIVGAFIVALGLFIGQLDKPVYAAPDNTIKSCDTVAIAGNTVVYYCEPEDGPPFYINSLGFMLQVQ